MILALTACQVGPTLLPPAKPPVQSTSTQPAPVEAEIEPEPTEATIVEPPVYVYQPNPNLPVALNQLIEQQALDQPQGNANEIAYTFEFSGADPIGDWVYTLVAPFPTVTDEVSATWLQSLWQGQPEGKIQTLLINESDLPALTSILGEPGETIRTLPRDQILETTWTTQNTWAIIPFEEIQPRWKVLADRWAVPHSQRFLCRKISSGCVYLCQPA